MMLSFITKNQTKENWADWDIISHGYPVHGDYKAQWMEVILPPKSQVYQKLCKFFRCKDLFANWTSEF